MERGDKGVNGYFTVYLEKSEKGRVPKMELTNDKTSLKWEGEAFFEEKKTFWFQIGFSISLANLITIVYLDSNKIISLKPLSEKFAINFQPQRTILMSKEKVGNYEGFVDMERFSLSNNVSGAVYQFLVKNQASKEMEKISQNCLSRTSSYFRNFDCQVCENAVLNKQTRQCQTYCDLNFKNAMTGVCLPCVKDKCVEIDTTKWLLMPEDEWSYRFVSSRPLLNDKINFKELLQAKIGGIGPNPDFFQYSVDQDPTQQ